MNNLVAINGSFMEALKLKAKTEQGYQHILNKVNKTLDAFKINDKREAFSEALIRLAMLEFEFPMEPGDAKVVVMFEMLSYFKDAVNQ